MIGPHVRRRMLAASLLVLVIGLVRPSVGQAQAMIELRTVHIASGAPAVDLVVDGQPLLANLAPRTASAYMPVAAGRHTVRVMPAGDANQTVLEAEVELPSAGSATLALLGAAPSYRALLLTDDNTAPPTGEAKVRFVHGVPDAPPVAVATSQGSILANGVSYGSGAAYASVPAGTYILQLRAEDAPTPLISVPNVTVSAGQIVTLFATGTAADNSLVAVPVLYQPTGVPPLAATAPEVQPRVLPVQMPATGVGLVGDHRLPAARLPLLGLLLALGGTIMLLRRTTRGTRRG